MSIINQKISGLDPDINDIELKQSYEQKSKLYGDVFWTEDYKILFTGDNIPKFIPNAQMTTIEKLNAIMRLGIYLGLALYLFTGTIEYLYIILIIGLLTYFIYKYQLQNIELYLNSYENSNFNKIQKSLKKEPININPTVNNPMMNINLITDDKTKEQAPKTWNDENIQDKVEEKFNYDLYRDVGDLYGKSNSQRQYYQMPSTTIPNEQTSFAKWLYATGPTCKETSIYCAPQMDAVPYIDNTNVTKELNVKY
jgi:hypothetical protein